MTTRSHHVDNTASDSELLAHSAHGDSAAFKILYKRHNKGIYNYLLRLIHRPTIAEDLLQEVFLAAWEGADNFRGEAKVKNWLFRIAHYQAASWLRKNREELTPNGELPENPVHPEGQQQVQRALAHRTIAYRIG